jgi:hypothetical protein
MVPTLLIDSGEGNPGRATMWAIAIFWLMCAAIFLELADRAPTLDDSGGAKRAVDVEAKIIQMPRRSAGAPRADKPASARTMTFPGEMA